MDIYKALRELYEERARLSQVIASLEQLGNAAPSTEEPRGRRGRRGMPPEERRKVSERMKQYWASRRPEGADSGG